MDEGEEKWWAREEQGRMIEESVQVVEVVGLIKAEAIENRLVRMLHYSKPSTMEDDSSELSAVVSTPTFE